MKERATLWKNENSATHRCRGCCRIVRMILHNLTTCNLDCCNTLQYLPNVRNYHCHLDILHRKMERYLNTWVWVAMFQDVQCRNKQRQVKKNLISPNDSSPFSPHSFALKLYYSKKKNLITWGKTFFFMFNTCSVFFLPPAPWALASNLTLHGAKEGFWLTANFRTGSAAIIKLLVMWAFWKIRHKGVVDMLILFWNQQRGV